MIFSFLFIANSRTTLFPPKFPIKASFLSPHVLLENLIVHRILKASDLCLSVVSWIKWQPRDFARWIAQLINAVPTPFPLAEEAILTPSKVALHPP